MIIVLKKETREDQIRELLGDLETRQLRAQLVDGERTKLVVVIGDAGLLDAEHFRSLPCVDAVHRVTDPYRKAGRSAHPDDTVVDVGGVKIGGGNFALIAGPCAVEDRERLLSIARSVIRLSFGRKPFSIRLT